MHEKKKSNSYIKHRGEKPKGVDLLLFYSSSENGIQRTGFAEVQASTDLQFG
jgi:hypothetical protein